MYKYNNALNIICHSRPEKLVDTKNKIIITQEYNSKGGLTCMLHVL